MGAEYGRQVHSCQSEPRGRSAKTSFCRASDYDPAGKQTGNLLAMTFATPNDTPALNAIKAKNTVMTTKDFLIQVQLSVNTPVS